MSRLVNNEISDRSVTPRVGVVGAGYWGQNLVRNFHAIGALAAVCDLDEERLRSVTEAYPRCQVYSDYDKLLRDSEVGAVVIATPAETHAAMVRNALLVGKDVFTEKPLCLSAAEGEELASLARQRRRILMVGHLLWYHPAILKLKQLIAEGALGRIQYIYSNRLNLGRIRREENILWSFAPHDISVILGLLDEMPDSVHAQGGNYLHAGIADVTVSLMSFPSGVNAHIFVSWLHPYKEQKLVIIGEHKMAVFDDVEKQDKLVLYPHSIDWKNNIPVANRAEGFAVELESYEPLRAECLHFVECVQSRSRPRTDGAEAVRVLRVLQWSQEALRSGSASKTATVAERPRAYTAHQSAVIDEGVEIGEGTTIWHFSHILRGSSIGKNCRIGQNVVVGPKVTVGDGVKIQNNVSVYEGVTLEDFVFCGPSMVFTNVYNPRSEIPRMEELRPTVVHRGATLGANCTIICGLSIGRYALVGAGSVVLHDVPDFALVVGNPARLAGWVCVCGHRLGLDSSDGIGGCTACGREYEKTGQHVELR